MLMKENGASTDIVNWQLQGNLCELGGAGDKIFLNKQIDKELN